MSSIAKWKGGYVFRWQSYNGRRLTIHTQEEKLVGTVSIPGSEALTPARVAKWIAANGIAAAGRAR